jgi:hypothetical protein
MTKYDSYFIQRSQIKAESLTSNSTGQRPVWLMTLLSLRPERAIAIRNRLTPLQGYGWIEAFHHRALLPLRNKLCAIAKRALPLTCRDMAKNY